MRTRTFVAAVVLAVVLGGGPAGAMFAGSGTPDPTFSGDGITRTKLGDLTFLTGLAMQGSRPVVAGAARVNGEFDAVLFRYTAKGALDPAFSGDGKVRLDVGLYDAFFDVDVMADGSLFAVGTSQDAVRNRFLAARFHADGRIDRSFGKDGVALTRFPDDDAQAFAALALPSGKAVACGFTRDTIADQSAFALARYRASGALDATFGGDGRVITRFPVRSENQCTGVGLATDGQVVASGTVSSAGPGSIAAGLARYRPNGALEDSFDGDGRVEISTGNYTTGEDVLVLKNNFFMLSGQWQRTGGGYAGYIAKVNSSGHLDAAWAKGGIRSVSEAGGDAKILGLARAPGGKLVGVGEWVLNSSPFTQFALITRVKPGGGPDGGFGTNGVVVMALGAGDTTAYESKVMSDGRVVLTGETETAGATARLLG